jgi:hypothetical protein
MPLLKDISGLLITKGLKLLNKGLYLGRGLIEAIPGPPNPSNIIRWFTKQENNTLIDSISSNDGDKILPVSTILATSIAEFTDLTGVTIISYSGDQLLSISGNNIISSGTGFVFDLLLSDGTFIPFLHLKTDVSGNENHILNITDIGKEYRLVGSSYLQDKGNVERNPELVVNGDFSDGLTGWSKFNSGTLSVTGGVLRVLNGGFCTAYQVVNTVIGKSYIINTNFFKSSINGILRVGITAGSGTILNETLTTSGAYRFQFISTANTIHISLVNSTSYIGDFCEWDNISLTLATPEIIPNTPLGLPAYPIVSGDTFIAGGGMMNLTDCLVRS